MTGAFLSEKNGRQKKEALHALITRIEWWNQRSLMCSVIEISRAKGGDADRRKNRIPDDCSTGFEWKQLD